MASRLLRSTGPKPVFLRKTGLGFVIGATVLLAACTTATPSQSPQISPTALRPTSTAATPPPAQDVTVQGAQGFALRGTWRAAGPSSPAVLLLHMYRGSRVDWAPEAEVMRQAGIASLALDLRGHGDTRGEEDWELAVEDVAAAHAWIAQQPEVDDRRRATVGASIGANLALTHAASDPHIRAVALLSPGMDYFGIKLEGVMSMYGERPILLAASDKDTYSADTVEVLAGEAMGPAILLVYPGSAHGTELLYRTQADFLPELIRFLEDSLGP
ncbi:MAG TPA: alpha/beta fold hydrolase [Anaerolineales bacterium]|nr:alpha/beta fold hydrolase [Anaerolineales bacterium]